MNTKPEVEVGSYEGEVNGLDAIISSNEKWCQAFINSNTSTEPLPICTGNSPVSKTCNQSWNSPVARGWP